MPNSGDDEPTDPLGRIGGPGSVSSAEAVEAAGSASESEAIEGPTATGGPDSTQAVARALASGALDSDAARTQLIDAAVRARMPHATPEAIAAVRAEVEALVGSDPVLEQLLRP